MKKLLFLSLTLLTVVALIFSCSSKKEDNVLKIATNAEYPPFEFKEDNQFKGIDMDLAKIISEKLGMKFEIVDIDFDAIIPSLTTGKVDMALSAITITEKRKEKIDFSLPYYIANQAIIAQKSSDIVISSESDLANYTIGVQNGTTGQIYIDDNLVKKGTMAKGKLKKYPTNIEAITDMMNGNIDLVVIDDSAAKGYERLKPIKTVYTIETGESYGIAFPKASPFKDKVNGVLDEILESDQWIQLLSKYL